MESPAGAAGIPATIIVPLLPPMTMLIAQKPTFADL
jgi:hypothetical protein